MKLIANVLIVLLALYGAYRLYEDYRQPPPPPPPAAIVPQAQPRTITCKTCAGRGRLADTSGGTHIGYECPICKGQGRATRAANATVCDYCDGWRLVSRPQKNREGRVMADKCPMCNSIKKR